MYIYGCIKPRRAFRAATKIRGRRKRRRHRRLRIWAGAIEERIFDRQKISKKGGFFAT
jgi:hypothetical protein